MNRTEQEKCRRERWRERKREVDELALDRTGGRKKS